MAAPADQKVNATYFTCTPVPGCCDQMEANLHLYLFQSNVAPTQNQLTIVNPQNSTNFGITVVNDWEVREGSDPGSKLVARAQGTHVQCGHNTPQWQASFNIVFEDDSSFKGSTLEVRGAWGTTLNLSVVGGTGQFSLAQGIVSATNISKQTNLGLWEVFIRVFYRTIEIQKTA